MHWFHIIAVASFLASVLVVGIALGLRRATRVHAALLHFSLVISVWMGFDLLFRLAPAPSMASILIRLEPLSWILAGVLLLRLVQLNTAEAPGRVYRGLWIASLVSLPLATLTPWVYSGYRMTPLGMREVFGPLFAPVAAVTVLVPAVLAARLIFAAWRRGSGPAERQPRMVQLISLAIAVLVGFVGDVVLPLLGLRGTPELTPLAVALFSIGQLVAIAHFQLLVPSGEELVADLLEQSRGGVVLLDAHGRVQRMNEAARDLLGWRSIGEIPEALRPVLLGDQRVTQGLAERVAWVGPEGPQVLTVQRALLERPHRRAWLVFLEDATRLVQLEEQAAQARQLDSIATLSAGVAHSLNNVLNVVTLITSYQHAQCTPDSRLAEDLSLVLRATERGTALIQDLLGFSRQGRFVLQRLSLTELVSSELAEATRAWPKRVQLVSELLPGPAPVLADAAQLRRALRHVLNNASEAITGTGEVRVAMELVACPSTGCPTNAELPPGDYLLVRIHDTGVGMDAQTRARACEPFFTTKGMAEASGMGLAMAYGAVAAHGGRLRLESATGQGTTVTIALPVAETVQGLPDGPVPRAAEPSEGGLNATPTTAAPGGTALTSLRSA